MLLGSTLGGMLALTPGPALVYGGDAVGFAASFVLLSLMPSLPGTGTGAAALRGITGGLRYAVRRPDLLDSYLADLAAMIFAYPNALFPFLAADLHARWATGLMFAAPSVGAFGVTVLSGWMGRIRRHDLAIVLSAAAWGLMMTWFGLSPDVYVGLACLVAAGAADMISGIFRDTRWSRGDCSARERWRWWPRCCRGSSGPGKAPEMGGAQRRRVPLGTGPMGS